MIKTKKKIYVYTGEGAYQARDIEIFLAVFELDYQRINENNLSKLTKFGILIMPGGEIPTLISSLNKTEIKRIKDFVFSGGTYIGICAGSYIAGKSFDGTSGFSFFNEVTKYNKSQGIIEVTDNMGNNLQLINENGPNLSGIQVDEIILKDANDNPHLVKINFGEGQVYLFSSHPEGSVCYEKYPKTFSGAKFLNQFLKTIQRF